MTRAALFVRVEAKTGKEKEVEELLKDGLHLVQDEPGTNSWYALSWAFQLSPFLIPFQTMQPGRLILPGR